MNEKSLIILTFCVQKDRNVNFYVKLPVLRNIKYKKVEKRFIFRKKSLKNEKR